MEIIFSKKVPSPIGPYSQAVKAGGLLFVSGQIGILPATGELTGPGFAEQARQAMENIHEIIKAAGLDLKHAVKFEVFLKDMTDFSGFNHIYEQFFDAGCAPARQVVGVSCLPKDALVEISCICEFPD